MVQGVLGNKQMKVIEFNKINKVNTKSEIHLGKTYHS